MNEEIVALKDKMTCPLPHTQPPISWGTLMLSAMLHFLQQGEIWMVEYMVVGKSFYLSEPQFPHS